MRIGLLAPRAGIALPGLPRGNQTEAAAVVIRHGLTVPQAERLVAELREHADDAARAAYLAQRLEAGPPSSAARPARPPRSEADGMMTDITTLLRVGAQLQARLLGAPHAALDAPAAEVILDGLGTLGPVLAALARTLATVLGKEPVA